MTQTVSNRVLYSWILGKLRPFSFHLTGILLLGLLSAPLALLTPLPLKIAVDSVIGSRPVPEFLQALLPAAAMESTSLLLGIAIVLVMIIASLGQLQGFGICVLSSYTGERLIMSFRAQVFRHMQRLSLSYHDTHSAAESIYRIQHDAACVKHIPIDGFIPFLRAGFTLFGMIYITALIDWQMAMVALGVSPILFVLTRTSGRKLRKKWSEVKYMETSTTGIVQEVFTALRVVKAFGREDYEQARFTREASHFMRGHIRLAFIGASFDFFVSMTIALGTAVALLIGVSHVRSGILTLGELLMVMAYLAQLYGPLETISKKVAEMQASLTSAERVMTLLKQGPDVPERPHARPLVRAKGHVVFRNVAFAYDPERTVLHNSSFEIEPGTRVGIVGTTGAGKTTLLNLLTRFYDPTSGQILLDGVDLRDYKVADLRNQFAVVLQDPVLFSTSIAENISYGRPGCRFEEIVVAAKAANAHDFIVHLRDGYDTQVGERGVRLSGGERQRLSLARAFLKRAPMLILDEPTSSVDTKTEAPIVDTMETLMRGRTTFIIAHRLSTLKNCDVQLVIEQGRLLALEPIMTRAMA